MLKRFSLSFFNVVFSMYFLMLWTKLGLILTISCKIVVSSYLALNAFIGLFFLCGCSIECIELITLSLSIAIHIA